MDLPHDQFPDSCYLSRHVGKRFGRKRRKLLGFRMLSIICSASGTCQNFKVSEMNGDTVCEVMVRRFNG